LIYLISQITRLGDVCVTPMSVNWSCKLADWVGQAQGYPNMCFLPGEIDGPSVSSLYGDCVFDTHTHGSIALAREILKASAGENALSLAPLRNSLIQVRRTWICSSINLPRFIANIAPLLKFISKDVTMKTTFLETLSIYIYSL
jgi:hypothetical protein